ncbi:DUF3558 domain-containing protein [Streptomyces sp. SID4985]|uniref:DUF3558 domain-containing protein n=2 Tax=unclassified Streptomyces TaxID=2593676 RepID=UPI00136C9E7F|nr:DUF3558 domain-containing protein [Streptomyces sp. SID4985]MYQ46657.1 DUF3558 domain-containing protein [Streptomyces sp. SID4985]
MSEGTMQRAVQRDDRAHHRAGRLSRVLVCAAAVPAVLITAGCSSDSGDSANKETPAAQQSAGGDTAGASSSDTTPTVAPAAYQKLPEPCAALTKKTQGELVPKSKSGKQGKTDDNTARSSCSWTSLADNGVKGSQFRWLSVSLLRFDSDAARGSGNEQAHSYYTQQLTDAQHVSDAKNTKSQPLTGTGDEATVVRYDLKKKEGAFKQQTVVARVQNVVVTLDYNGAGLAGEKTPDADDLTKKAEKAAKEAIAFVSAANGRGQAPSSSGGASASPSQKPSGKPSAPASGKPSQSASPSASASAEADKKS